MRVDVTGGTGDYTYLWNSGQTENPINLNLNPGIYSVQITDENMCIIDTAFGIALLQRIVFLMYLLQMEMK